MRYLSSFFFLLLLAFLSARPVAADEKVCALAWDINEKAVEAFRDDKAEGLRLFIKAQEYCSEDPVLAYNLGEAYWLYGSRDKAIEMFSRGLKRNEPSGEA